VDARTGGPAAAPRARIGNRYDLAELGGAFGDLGTLIPFVLGYIVVLGVDPLGILLMFGVCQLAAGLYYRTPIPVQPMKAIGAAAIASGGSVSAGVIAGAGLFTGAFWLVAGASGLVDLIGRLASRPVVRGVMLGLGLSFMRDGLGMMRTAPGLAAAGFGLTLALLAWRRVPAMLGLLLLGAAGAWLLDPEAARLAATVRPHLRFPSFTLGGMSWNDLVAGSLLLALPQIPLTAGNAVLAIRAENNELFPDRPVTDRLMAISQGIINLVAAPFGGIPMCHGAGGMAGHVRFGARTGGSLVMLGGFSILLALLFADSVGALFQAFPRAILGVILFFAGAELALTIRDVGDRRADVYLMLVVAALAMVNVGAAFAAGVVLAFVLRRGWIEI
jgi:MFS superfamily sulfate permease-like transporter